MNRQAARAAIGLAFLLAIATMAYGLFLVAIGPVQTIVPEGADPNGPLAQHVRIPAANGWIPLVGGSLVVAGIVTRRPAVLWLGAAVLAGYAMLFLFGNGGVLLPLVAVLLILLAVVSLEWRRETTLQS